MTLDNGYHLGPTPKGQGDIHLLCLHGARAATNKYREDTAEQLKKQG